MELPRTIGRYQLIRPIGEGSMARVVLATDSILGRRVAIKMLRPDLDLDAEAKRALFARLRREACAIAELSHPHLVTIYDLGEDDAVGLYIVFEYVDGLSLRERLLQGPLSSVEVARLAREIGGALSHAHDAGFCHRDVKPENILLGSTVLAGPTGSKLSDLGLARLPDEGGSALPPSTTAYTAPEALRSDDFGPLADQFSLGATLYEAVSARRAFPGSDALRVATQVAEDNPPPIATETRLDSRVDVVLRRALQKDPQARFSSCRAFGEALATAIEQSPSVSSHPSEAPPRSVSIVPRKTRRVQNVVAGIGLLVIVLLFFFGRTPVEGISMKSIAASFVAVLSSHAPLPGPIRHPTAHKATGTIDDKSAADADLDAADAAAPEAAASTAP